MLKKWPVIATDYTQLCEILLKIELFDKLLLGSFKLTMIEKKTSELRSFS